MNRKDLRLILSVTRYCSTFGKVLYLTQLPFAILRAMVKREGIVVFQKSNGVVRVKSLHVYSSQNKAYMRSKTKELLKT